MTETQDVTITAVHLLCECVELASQHQPGQCQNDASYTCSVCGRQVCGDCITSAGYAKGQSRFDPNFDDRTICFSCDGSVR